MKKTRKLITYHDDQMSQNNSNSLQGTQDKLLIVGPLPPPMTGTHVTFQTVCDELIKAGLREQIEIIDTSQKHVKANTRIISTGNYRQARQIWHNYQCKLPSAKRVLIFGSNGFLASLAPLLVSSANRRRIPVHVRAFGGSLDRVLEDSNFIKRWMLRKTLNGAESVSVQTALLKQYLTPRLKTSVFQTPGFRQEISLESKDKLDSQQPLRLIFVGLMRQDKGIVILLRAMRLLADEGRDITCDFYGPTAPASGEFVDEFRITRGAQYCGILQPNAVVAKMASYHALIFPSFYAGEGHPGVLIESMLAGIGVVTTRFRSIPELVEHDKNGLLVAPRDVKELAAAIRLLDDHRDLLSRLAQNNWCRRSQFLAGTNVAQLMRQMGVKV